MMEQNQLDNNEMEIDLREVIAILLQKAWIILLASFLCAGIVMVWTKLFVTPMYQSITKMYVLTQQNSSTITSSDLSASEDLTKDYVELVKSRTVLETVIEQLQLDTNYKDFLKCVEVTNTDDTRILTIATKDENPEMARQIADAVRVVSSKRIKEVMNIEAVNVVDEAHLPDEKHSPSTVKNGTIAGILGIVISVGVILVMHFMNDTILSSEDVEKYLGLSVLGNIPVDEKLSGKKKNVIRRRWVR